MIIGSSCVNNGNNSALAQDTISMELVHSSHVMNRRVDASSLFTERLQRLHGSQGDFLDLPSLDDRFLLLESIKVVFRGLHTCTLEHIAVEDLDKLDIGTTR